MKINHTKMRVILLVVIILLAIAILYQCHQNAKAAERYAYVVSSAISQMEDYLYLKYDKRPSELGLEELQTAWLYNPCRQTAVPYYEALAEAMEYLSFENTPEATTVYIA